jgi:membrane protein YdbS with pleckstrin-like domain
MELKFECPNCGQHLSATRAQIGMTTSCPNCNSAVTVLDDSRLSSSLSPSPPAPDTKRVPLESTRTDIYVYKDDKQLGPLENAQVAEALRSGNFSYDDIAWREGWTDWRPLRTLFPPPPPAKRSVPSATSALRDSERVVWTGNPSHWLYAAEWTLAILLLPILVGLIIIPYIYLDRARRLYRVTTTKVAIEYGIWIKSSNEIRISDIRSINITRRGLAGLAGVGNLEFSSAATDRAEVVFAAITEPEIVRQIVSKLQDEKK